MANVRNSNSYYIDTQFATNEELAEANLRVTRVIVTATDPAAILVLANSGNGYRKLEVRLPTSGTTQVIDLGEEGILFPSGIRPLTVTNCVATALFTRMAGG